MLTGTRSGIGAQQAEWVWGRESEPSVNHDFADFGDGLEAALAETVRQCPARVSCFHLLFGSARLVQLH